MELREVVIVGILSLILAWAIFRTPAPKPRPVKARPTPPRSVKPAAAAPEEESRIIPPPPTAALQVVPPAPDLGGPARDEWRLLRQLAGELSTQFRAVRERGWACWHLLHEREWRDKFQYCWERGVRFNETTGVAGVDFSFPAPLPADDSHALRRCVSPRSVDEVQLMLTAWHAFDTDYGAGLVNVPLVARYHEVLFYWNSDYDAPRPTRSELVAEYGKSPTERFIIDFILQTAVHEEVAA